MGISAALSENLNFIYMYITQRYGGCGILIGDSLRGIYLVSHKLIVSHGPLPCQDPLLQRLYAYSPIMLLLNVRSVTACSVAEYFDKSGSRSVCSRVSEEFNRG